MDRVPLSFLLGGSSDALENFEMKKLAEAACLEKEAAVILRESRCARAAAEAARFLRLHREEILRAAGSHLQVANPPDEKPRLLPAPALGAPKKRRLAAR